MAVLDNVLQAPPQTRQPHTGPRSERNVEPEKRDRTKSFETALAKSGLKDEATAATEETLDGTNTTATTATDSTIDLQSKGKASKSQSKMPQIKLMDLLSKDAKSAPETGKTSLSGTKDLSDSAIPEDGLEQDIQTFLADETIAKVLSSNVTDPKNPVAELQGKLKELADKYISLIEAAKSGGDVSHDPDKIAAAAKTATSDKPAKTEKTERLEKLEKALKAAFDKKTDAPDEDPIQTDDLASVQDMLDILGGTPAAASTQAQVVLAQPVADSKSGGVADALAAISQIIPHIQTKTDPVEKDEKGGEQATNPNKTSAMPESDADRIFHFSRADGTGKSIDLKIGGSKGPTTETDGTPGPQAKTENVVVLDARRYLALAPDSNAFNIVAQISGDKDLSTALTSSIIDPDKAAATSKVVNTLKLQMNPLELGTVTATLRLRGEDLSVAITVQNSHAYQQLSNDQDKMIEALRAQGFSVDQVTVQLVSADRPAFQDQQQPSGQGQQQARDDAAAQQGRQQGNGTARENPSQRNWQSAENTLDVASGNGASDSSRSGQVYI